MKTRLPKPHTDAFWEALVRRGVTPEQAAPHLPDFSEFEIAAEMTKARSRLDEHAQEKARAERDSAGPLLLMGGESCWGYRVSSARGKR